VGLEQADKLLSAVLTSPAQLLERVQLHGRQRGRLRLFHLVELDEVAIADCGGDMAGAIMFVAGALHNQEHAN
jgi:hypothetical protein